MYLSEWLNSEKVIEKSKKYYAHFDYRTDLSKCAKLVSNPKSVSSHGFFPFIHYVKETNRYSSSKGKVPKKRDICYASHIDRCIYQTYSFILNQYYIQRIKENGIFDVPVAYRSDLHKNNAEIAKIAFDFIRTHSPCFVMVGDFTKFFDSLDHKYLKDRWCSLLNVPRLPDDHYAVFKNITKFSTWELTDLLALNGLEDNVKGRRTLNAQQRVLSNEDFHKYRTHIEKHTSPFGIPQGSPISALLANVYMLDVDKYLNEIVTSRGGIYMRYSDDFIIILPNLAETDAVDVLLGITDYLNIIPGLTLEKSKTQFFRFSDNLIENCGKRFHSDSDNSKRFLNFLGFTFDGQKVTIRQKTIAKYYHQMYRKAKTIEKCGGITPKGNKISKRNLYELYSFHGAKAKPGNFFTYVDRSMKVFENKEPIDRDVKRHMQKIRKALKGKNDK